MLKFSLGTLLTLTLLGGYCIHGFSARNGFYDTVTKYRDSGVLPDAAGTLYAKNFTGLSPLDDLLGVLLTFFWPVIDGDNPTLSALSLLFAAQSIAAWTVTMLEGQRAGNSGRLVSFTTVYGMLVQTMGFALIGPAYLLLHLFTAQSTIILPTPQALHIPEAALRAIPYSITIGFMLPSIAMSLPSPTMISQRNKIYAILIWQAFPLWTQIVQTVLQNTVFAASPKTTTSQEQLRLLRRAYKFALFISVQAQVAITSTSVATLLFPSLFSTVALQQLHPRSIFVPPSPFSDAKVGSLAQGALWFIQFDQLFSGLAYLVWGLTVKYGAKKEWKLGNMLGDIATRANVLGYMSSGLTYIWERDEMVLGGDARAKEKKTQ